MSTIAKNLPTPPNGFSTTLSSSVASSALTLPLNSVVGLGTEGVGVLFKKDSAGAVIASSVEYVHWTGVSGNNLTLSDTGDRGVTGSYNGAQAFSNGDYFEVWVSSHYYAGTANLVEHNADGTHNFHGLTEKTTPVDADEVAIVDSEASNALKRLTLATLRKILYSPLSAQTIINGGFTVNQRGYVSNAVLASGAYGHDRWKAGTSGGDYTFTQLASATQITIKSGKSLIQVVEDKNVVGGTYTLSWEGTAQARFGKDSATPSGAYASSPITITGQTAGTVMSVEFNAGTLGKVQLNVGSVALPFQAKSFEEELRACLRYYETGQVYWQAQWTTNFSQPNGIHFSVAKRTTTPTILLYSTTTGTVGKIRNVSASTDINGDKSNLGNYDFRLFVNNVSVTQGHELAVNWTGDAEL